MDIISAVNNWSERKITDRLLRAYGGIQECPWCSQIVQKKEGWLIKAWDRDPMLDVITCGPCGGKSLWRFEIGFIYIGPLDPPKPKHKAVTFYDIDSAMLVSASGNEPAPHMDKGAK